MTLPEGFIPHNAAGGESPDATEQPSALPEGFIAYTPGDPEPPPPPTPFDPLSTSDVELVPLVSQEERLEAGLFAPGSEDLGEDVELVPLVSPQEAQEFERQRDDEMVRTLMGVAASEQPDQYARIMAIGDAFGLDYKSVRQRLPELERSLEQRRLDPAQWRRDNPGLWQWVQNKPARAGLVKAPEVGWFVRATRWVGAKMDELELNDQLAVEGFADAMTPWAEGGEAAETDRRSAAQKKADELWGEITNPKMVAKERSDLTDAKGLDRAKIYGDVWGSRRTGSELSFEASALMSAKLGLRQAELLGQDAAPYRARIYAHEERIQQLQLQQGRAKHYGQNAAEQLGIDVVTGLASQFDSFQAMGAGAAAGGAVAGAGAFIGTRSTSAAVKAAKFGASIGTRIGTFASSFGLERGSAFLEFRNSKDEHGNVMDEDVALMMANIYGLGAAGIETSLLGFTLRALGPLGKELAAGRKSAVDQVMKSPAARSKLKRLAQRFAEWGAEKGKAALAEGGEEVAQNTLQFFSEWAGHGALLDRVGVIDWDQLRDSNAESLYQGVIAGGAGTIVGSVAMHPINKAYLYGARRHASQRGQIMSAAVSGLAMSEMAQRMPKDFAEFVAWQSEQAGQKVTHVYIDPVQLTRVLQDTSDNIDQDITDLLGENAQDQMRRALAEAADSDGSRATLAVPVEKFFEKWGGNPIIQTLRQDITTNREHYTPREDAEYRAQIDDEAKRWVELARNDPDSISPTDRKLASAIARQLRETRRMTPEEIQAAVALEVGTIRAMASRIGERYEDFAALWTMKIDSEVNNFLGINQDARFLTEYLDTRTPEQRASIMYVDPNTGIRNERAFREEPLDPERPMVAFLSIPGVKWKNSEGHTQGNELYRIAAQALVALNPTAAKWRGDFVATVATPKEAYELATKMGEAMRDKMRELNPDIAERIQAPRIAVTAAYRDSGQIWETVDKAADANTKLKKKAEARGKRKPRGVAPFGIPVEKPQHLNLRTPVPDPVALPEHLTAIIEKMDNATLFDAAFSDAQQYGQGHTTLLTREAFFLLQNNPATALPVVVSVDANGLKAANDEFGKAAGDAIIMAIGEAAAMLGSTEMRGAHLSGDEFAFAAHTEEEAQVFIDLLGAALQDGLEFEIQEGARSGEVTKIPITFGYGIGADYDSADARVEAHKQRDRDNPGAERSERARRFEARGRGDLRAWGARLARGAAETRYVGDAVLSRARSAEARRAADVLYQARRAAILSGDVGRVIEDFRNSRHGAAAEAVVANTAQRLAPHPAKPPRWRTKLDLLDSAMFDSFGTTDFPDSSVADGKYRRGEKVKAYNGDLFDPVNVYLDLTGKKKKVSGLAEAWEKLTKGARTFDDLPIIEEAISVLQRVRGLERLRLPNDFEAEIERRRQLAEEEAYWERRAMMGEDDTTWDHATYYQPPRKRKRGSKRELEERLIEDYAFRASAVAQLKANLTAEEWGRIKAETAAKVLDLLTELPPVNEMAVIAQEGQAKRGWYEKSAQALMTVFGHDAPRFAMLLASLSPRVSVEANLKNALAAWAAWNKAGRPASNGEPALIKVEGPDGKLSDRANPDNNLVQILADALPRSTGRYTPTGEWRAAKEGAGPTDHVLAAWAGNVVRAFDAQTPGEDLLSGPKVNSFYRNLIGVTGEVTNDAWMAAYALVNQKLFSGTKGTKDAVGQLAVKGYGYMAMSAQVRATATRLTELTGDQWTPDQVQETIWAWAKTLYELADATGRTPEEVIAAGDLTDELIAATPDFSALFLNEEYEATIREAGYGEQLDELLEQHYRDEGGKGSQAREYAKAFAPSTRRAHVRRAARRLGTLREQRRADSERKRAKRRVETLDQPKRNPLPGRYSAAHRAVAKAKAAKNSADGWLNVIRKTPGVRADELKFLGLEKWLNARESKSIEREAVLTFIEQHQLRVERAQTGTSPMFDAETMDDTVRALDRAEIKLANARLEQQRELLVTRREMAANDITFSRHERDTFDRINLLNELEEYIGNAKYQLEAYGDPVAARRELRYSEEIGRHDLFQGLNDPDMVAMRAQLDVARVNLEVAGSFAQPKFESYTLKIHPPGTYREETYYAPGFAEDYEEGHWGHLGDQGVIGHGRVSEWLMPDGIRAMGLEEAQSTLANDVRKSGGFERRVGMDDLSRQDSLLAMEMHFIESVWVDPSKTDKESLARAALYFTEGDIEDAAGLLAHNMRVTNVQEHRDEHRDKTDEQLLHELRDYLRDMGEETAKLAAEDRRQYLDLVERQQELRAVERRQKYQGKRQSPVPFVTEWPEFIAKQLVVDAVADGYTRIAWTTGQQHAERYNLGAVADELRWVGGAGESGVLRAYRDGDVVFLQSLSSADALADYIGPQAAEDLLAAEPDRGTRTLAIGAETYVGGKGFQIVYDQRIPKEIAKLAKRYGARPRLMETVKWQEPLAGDLKRPEYVIDGEVVDEARVVSLLTDGAAEQLQAASFDTVTTGAETTITLRTRQDGEVTVSVREQTKPPKGPEVWVLDIPPELANAVREEGLPLFQDEDGNRPRGYVDIIRDGLRTMFHVWFTERSDPSTWVHETAHIHFEMLTDLAADPDADGRVRSDFNTILEFLGATDGNITTEQKETFARAFEAYMMEGRAPSIRMAEAMAAYRHMMLTVYGSVADLSVDLTDEMRQVFDRMLATDAEIKRVRDIAGLARPLFRTPEEAGMTAKQFEEYKRHEAYISNNAAQNAQVAWAEATLKGKKLFRSNEMRKFKEEAAEEYEKLPAVRAAKYLRDGTWTDEETGETSKNKTLGRLSRGPTLRLVGEDAAVLSKVRLTKDGEHPSTVATTFGYTGNKPGLAMLEAVAQLPDRTTWIRERAEEIALERHPEVEEDIAQLTKIIEDGVHQDFTLKMLNDELRALKKRAKKARRDADPMGRAAPEMVTAQALKAAAQQLAMDTPIGELSTEAVIRREQSAANAAFDAVKRGDYRAAIEAQHLRILYQHLYRETRDAIAMRDRFSKLTAQLKTPRARERLGKADEYFLLVNDYILEAIGILPPNTDPDRKTGFETAAVGIAQLGEDINYDFDTVAGIVRDAPGDWRQLPFEQFIEVMRALAANRTIANHWSRIQLANERLTIEEFAERVEQETDWRLDHPNPPKEHKAKAWVSQAYSSLLEPQEILWKMGPSMYRAIWEEGYLKAEQREDELAARVGIAVEEMWDRMPKKIQRSRFDVVEDIEGVEWPDDLPITERITRQMMLMIALNMGNASNRERLLGGYHWNEQQVLDWLNRNMEPEEWQFVQSIWKLLDETLWPEVKETYRKARGMAPPKIEATPIVTPHGTVSGGYFPARYDHHFSRMGRQQIRDMADYRDQAGKVSVMQSFTKRRAAHYQDVVSLDWGVVPSHIMSVIHYVAFDDFIRSAGRVMENPRVRNVMTKKLGRHQFEQITSLENGFLRRASVTVQQSSAREARALHSVLSGARQGLVSTAIGWNITTAIADLVSPLNAALMGEVGMLDVAMSMAKFYSGADMVSSPFRGGKNSWQYAVENSPELRHRRGQVTRMTRYHLDAIGKRGVNRTLRAIQESAWVFLDTADKIVSTVIWDARYRQATRQGKPHDRAVQLADRAVQRSMPVMDQARMAAVMSSKLPLVFFGYFSKLGNQVFATLDPAIQELGGAESYGETFAATGKMAWRVGRVLGLFAVAQIAGEILAGRGKEEDETWAQYLARKAIASPFVILPFMAGPATSIVDYVITGDVKPYNPLASPSFAAFEIVYRAAMGGLSENSENDRAYWMALRAVGVVTKTPIGGTQMRRTTQYAWRPRDTSIPGVVSGGVWGENEKRRGNPVNMAVDALTE